MTVLTLAHLYPREMNIYGDTGNVLVLRKRLQWRGMDAKVVGVHVGDPLPADTDILLGGGGQDAAQGEIGRDFVGRGAELRAMADDGVVMLTICGSYQLLGHHFLTKDGRRIDGVGVLDVVTTGSDQRLIGNNHIDTDWGRLVGFENHSGLTELGPGAEPLGRTVAGRGNNGPVLAKSPRFADELLRRALARRGEDADLEPLDDSLALAAADVAIRRPR
jgi:CobQ-like glutamine amidotransferase family enzyme